MSFKLVFRSVWHNPGNSGRRVSRLYRAIKWQIYKRSVRTPKRIRLANGTSFIAHSDCVVSSALIYADWPEFHELRFVRRQLKPGEVLIDVGANVGHIGLLLSDITGAENIFAFEPTPITFERLRTNWKVNGWPAENLIEAAVGSQAGWVRMPNPGRPETKNGIGSDSEGEEIEVRLVALDDYLALWSRRPIGLLKMDVEGYEPEVFAGANHLLGRNRPRLIMFESLIGGVDPEIEKILRKARYVAFQLDEAGRPDLRHSCNRQNLFASPEEVLPGLV